HELAEPFMRADFTEVLRLMDRRFGTANYSLRSLFRDERRELVQRILAAALSETETLYRQVYDQRAPLMRFLTHLHMPLPSAFAAAAECVLNNTLGRALAEERIDAARVKQLCESAKFEGITLDHTTLEFTYHQTLDRLAGNLTADPSLAALQALHNAAGILDDIPFHVNLWQVQNDFYQILHNVYPKMRGQAESGDTTVASWLQAFDALGKQLRIKIS
ncbi:MAG TPA: hypothetical protein VNT76_01045, partial [Candidatus Binatus sp.]|nr:hypothetical protein [Candidatus Binatus sp.]